MICFAENYTFFILHTEKLTNETAKECLYCFAIVDKGD